MISRLFETDHHGVTAGPQQLSWDPPPQTPLRLLWRKHSPAPDPPPPRAGARLTLSEPGQERL